MIKAAMTLCGLPAGSVRAPLIELSAQDRNDLDALLVSTALKEQPVHA
jgi:dihydrodipicolinate synthase/N-acetylneuraminate lyase